MNSPLHATKDKENLVIFAANHIKKLERIAFLM